MTRRLRAEVDKRNWNRIKFSVELNNIDVFEQINKLRINVYSFYNR